MRKIALIILMFVCGVQIACAQVGIQDRIGFTKGFFAKNHWIDSLRKDSNNMNAGNTLPTSKAVYDFVTGRLAGVTGGSGTNNANTGSGYRIIKPATQDVKTLFAGLDILIDSTSNTNGLTFKLDTATAFTQLRSTLLNPMAGLDTNSYSKWRVVQDNLGNTYRTHAQRVFNVKDFGAVGDGVNDDTEEIAAAIAACFANGGGTVYFPLGTYLVRGIDIPATQDTEPLKALVFEGEGFPATLFGTIGNFALPTQGVILKLHPSYSGNSLFRQLPGSNPGYLFSFNHVVMKNITFMNIENPQSATVNMQYAFQMSMYNCHVTTNVYNVNSVQPNNAGGVGIYTPEINNGALTFISNSTVTGHYTGIAVNEHTYSDHLNIFSCYRGLYFMGAAHSSLFNRLDVARCRTKIEIGAMHVFIITDFNVEYPGSGQTTAPTAWQNKVYDINDPSNLGYGEIHYREVEGGVGGTYNWVVNGASNIQYAPIGQTLMPIKFPSGATLTSPSGAIVSSAQMQALGFIPTGSSIPTNGLYLPTTNSLGWSTNSTNRMTLNSNGELMVNISDQGDYKAQIGGNLIVGGGGGTGYGSYVTYSGGQTVGLKTGTSLAWFVHSGQFGIAQSATPLSHDGTANYSLIIQNGTYNALFGTNMAYNIGDKSAQLAAITTASKVGFKVIGASSQTANLTEWLNNSDVVLAAITAAGNLIIATKTPSSASDTGTTGMVAWDASYVYVCTATNTWKRVAIATW